MPVQISARVDRLIQRLTKLDCNVALFANSHPGRVLAGYWIGSSVEYAQPFLLNAASLGILCFEHDRRDQLAIELWNSAPLELFSNQSSNIAQVYATAIQRRENEGGETFAA